MAIDPPARATGISVVRVLWLQISIKMCLNFKGAALVGYIPYVVQTISFCLQIILVVLGLR
jgi:hypothetical protein